MAEEAPLARRDAAATPALRLRLRGERSLTQEIYDVMFGEVRVGGIRKRTESSGPDPWSWSCIDDPGRNGERMVIGLDAAKRAFRAHWDELVARGELERFVGKAPRRRSRDEA
jgi:hypothetical protein